MLNPIHDKIKKVFYTNKKSSKIMHRTQSAICPSKGCEYKRMGSSGLRMTQPQTEFQNSFNVSVHELETMRKQLNEYKTLTQNLRQKLRDHELLQQFYLTELKNRSQIEKELKWKLDMIGQQIRSNTFSVPCRSNRVSDNFNDMKENIRYSQNC